MYRYKQAINQHAQVEASEGGNRGVDPIHDLGGACGGCVAGEAP